MKCCSCNHFLARGLTLAKESPTEKRRDPGSNIGVCRHSPPRAIYDPDDQDVLSVFPAVHRDQSCGKYEPVGGWRSPC
jgi:hypothetical protein